MLRSIELNKTIYLIKIMEDFLNGNIEASKFVDEYESFFIENENLIEKEVDKEVYDVLGDLITDLGYFEPHKEIRKEDPSYFGEKKLIKEVQEAYDKIEEKKEGGINQNG